MLLGLHTARKSAAKIFLVFFEAFFRQVRVAILSAKSFRVRSTKKRYTGARGATE